MKCFITAAFLLTMIAGFATPIFRGCDKDATIQINLMGGARSAFRFLQGIYEKSATVNGKPTWTQASNFTHKYALWYSSNGNGYWIIGYKSQIGGPKGWLYAPVSGQPYGNGNEFFYWDGARWVKPINEIVVKLECMHGPGYKKLLIGPDEPWDFICPDPTYRRRLRSMKCCCGNGCCWDQCDWSSPPSNCLQEVPNSKWIYNSSLGYYQAYEFVCPTDSDSRYRVINSKCYYFNSHAHTYGMAQIVCNEKFGSSGGRLAEPRTKATFASLWSAAASIMDSNRSPYWIGVDKGFTVESNGQFRYASTNSVATFPSGVSTNFESFFKDFNCVKLNSATNLEDDWCRESYASICEIK